MTTIIKWEILFRIWMQEIKSTEVIEYVEDNKIQAEMTLCNK